MTKINILLRMKSGLYLCEKCTNFVFKKIFEMYGHTCGQIGIKNRLGDYGPDRQVQIKWAYTKQPC